MKHASIFNYALGSLMAFCQAVEDSDWEALGMVSVYQSQSQIDKRFERARIRRHKKKRRGKARKGAR